MSSENAPLTPAEVFAQRVKEARTRRGWTQRQLAERLTDLDYPTDRTAVLRIETGKRADVRLSDVFAFALALDVWPLHLIVPLEDEAPIAVTPARVVAAPKARAWIRGLAMLRGTDPSAVFAQLPESEQRALIDAVLSRREKSELTRALMADDRAEAVELVMQAFHEREEESDG
jgi:transcriptional regulator with XRE-family HTH domain